MSHNPRKNLVIEGLKGEKEEEMITNLIHDHNVLYENVNTIFEFIPPAIDEMYGYTEQWM